MGERNGTGGQRLSDDEFWDAAALNAVRALGDSRWKDGGQYAPEGVAMRAAAVADALLAERRARTAAET